MADYNNKDYQEYNDFHDTSRDYVERTHDENANPYESSSLGKRKGISLATALKMMTTVSSITLVGTGVATGVIPVFEEGTPVLVDGDPVSIYLDLTTIGLFEGKAGIAYPDKNINNGVKLDVKVGDLLPVGTKITSSTGQTFKEWLHYEEGDTTGKSYTKVAPAEDYVYVASFNDDAVKYTTFNDVPSFLSKADYTYLGWTWNGETGQSGWFELEYDKKANTLTGVVPEWAKGINLCAVYKGSDSGIWDGYLYTDVPGRVYFQTKNIDIIDGKYDYSGAVWLSHPNPYPVMDDAYMVVVTGIPSYIYKGDYDYWMFSWDTSASEARWFLANFIGNDTLVSNALNTADGASLCAVKKGTVTPDWSVTSDSNGRIYYQSNDINFVSGQTTYTSPSWKTYP